MQELGEVLQEAQLPGRRRGVAAQQRAGGEVPQVGLRDDGVREHHQLLDRLVDLQVLRRAQRDLLALRPRELQLRASHSRGSTSRVASSIAPFARRRRRRSRPTRENRGERAYCA